MYAVIQDDHDLSKPNKLVHSVHRTRDTAEKALKMRWRRFRQRVWESDDRVVWVEGRVRAGECITPECFSTWAPGEKIPYGETHSDTD